MLILNAFVGLLFLKAYPKRWLLVLYLLFSIICLILTIGLFGWTAYLLEKEDRKLKMIERERVTNEDVLELNKIVTNTKLAMYSLQMVLAPIHGRIRRVFS